MESRAAESEQKRVDHLAKNNATKKKSREARNATESEQEIANRREKERAYCKKFRDKREATESIEQRQARLAEGREQYHTCRKLENDKYAVHEWDTEYRGGVDAEPRAGQCRGRLWAR